MGEISNAVRATELVLGCLKPLEKGTALVWLPYTSQICSHSPLYLPLPLPSCRLPFVQLYCSWDEVQPPEDHTQALCDLFAADGQFAQLTNPALLSKCPSYLCFSFSSNMLLLTCRFWYIFLFLFFPPPRIRSLLQSHPGKCVNVPFSLKDTDSKDWERDPGIYSSKGSSEILKSSWVWEPGVDITSLGDLPLDSKLLTSKMNCIVFNCMSPQ